MTRTLRTLLNASSGYVRLAVTAATIFCLTPIIIDTVGRSHYGLWSLVFAVSGVVGLLDFGMLTCAVKYVGDAKGRGDPHDRDRIVSTIAATYVVLTVIALIAVAGLAFVFNRLFAIPAQQQSIALVLVWVIGVRVVLVSLPLALFRGILFGEQEITVINLAQAISVVVYGMASWIALRSGHGVIALAWINMIVAMVEHAAYIVWTYRVVPSLRIAPSLVSWTLSREILAFGATQLVVNMASLVRVRSDLLIVKLFLPLSAVGVYAVALKVAEQLHFLVKQGLNVVAPLVAELHGAGERDKIRFILLHVGKYAIAPAAALAVASVALGHDAIVAWVGPEFAGAAPLLAILLTATAFAMMEMTASSVLAMTGYHRPASRAVALSAVVNVAVSIILVPRYGLLGIATGALVAAVTVDTVVLPRLACRLHQIDYGRYVATIALAILPPAAAEYAFLTAARTWFQPRSLGSIAFLGGTGLLLYGLVFWHFSVPKSEKSLLSEKLFRRHAPRPLARAITAEQGT